MKKTLQFLLALLFTATFSIEVLACDPPTNLRYQIEENVPGYSYKYRITFSWDAVDGAEYYSVYYHAGNYSDYWLGDTDGLYYIVGTEVDNPFEFSVKTQCSNGSSEMSEHCTVTFDEQPCPMPENLQATVEEDMPNAEFKYTITLSWDAVDNAEKYELYVNGDMFTYTTETTYVTGTDTPQVLYFAVATICEDGGESIISPSVMVNIDPCMPPTNLQANVEEDVPGFPYKYKVTLTWDANPDASSYTIYENGTWKSYATTNSIELGYDSPTTVFYNVTSSCENGESDMTDPLTVVIGGTDGPCLAPTNLGATIEQDVEGYEYKFKVIMTWDAADGAEVYFVYVNGQEWGASSTNSYIFGTDAEGSWEITVVSVCANGESEQSEPYTLIVQEDSLEEYSNRFEVYPNPAESNITINTNENINEINIYNIIGIKVYSEQVSVDRCPLSVDLSTFNSGVYFIKINTEKGDIVKRFIKE